MPRMTHERRHSAPWHLLLVALCVPACAHAARPMITDDARLVDPKACQVESWVRRERTDTQSWAVPACNVTGNLELALGFGRIRDATGAVAHDRQVQAKSLVRPLATNGWGIGYAVGTVGHSAAPRDYYGYIPVSRSLLDDRVVLHFNAGLLRDGSRGQTRATWGVGSETQLAPRTWLVAEQFSQEEGRPFHHVGVRHWIVENRVQVDLTYGNRNGRSSQERWVSLGVRLLSPAFLP